MYASVAISNYGGGHTANTANERKREKKKEEKYCLHILRVHVRTTGGGGDSSSMYAFMVYTIWVYYRRAISGDRDTYNKRM